MKMNVEIEIDYIDEDGNLDDSIKTEIIEKLSKQIQEKVKNEVSETITTAAQKTAQEACETMLDDFINKTFNVTNQWGDEIQTNVSIREIIKRKFEEYWKELVDSRGGSKERFGSGPYQERVKWLIDKEIEVHSKEFAKTLTNDTENKIKAKMTKSLRDSLGSKLMTELSFDKLLLESKTS